MTAEPSSDRTLKSADRWIFPLWFASLLCAALTMGLTFAHVLELPQKMGFGQDLWTRVEHNLYAYFAIVGGPLEMVTVVLLAGLTFVLRRRRRPGSGFALAAAACYAAALASWFVLVSTANAHIGTWTSGSIPSDWTRWRAQWEYGHALGFAFMLAGFVVLLVGTARILPLDRSAARLTLSEPTGDWNDAVRGYGTITVLSFPDGASRAAALQELNGLIAATTDLDGMQRIAAFDISPAEMAMVTVYDSEPAAEAASSAVRPRLGDSIGRYASAAPQRWAGPIVAGRKRAEMHA